MKISVVINALNAQNSIEAALKSSSWADEIVVVDDGSTDKTIEIAKKYTKNIYHHKSVGFVEPARNLAISKATGEWVFILDTDEEIPYTLADKLKEIVNSVEQIDYVEIPRKNIIFGKWMKASFWWPDNHIRFFKKGKVVWSDRIHSKPQVSGSGITLPAEEDYAITHYNYQSVPQFLDRMNRYSTIQSKELFKDGYQFKWTDLIQKPLAEFLTRFFANRGYKDGLHGLALSLLQAFSFLVVYLKVWEVEKFNQQTINLGELKQECLKSGQELNYWFKISSLSKNPLKRILQKINQKFSN